MGPPIKVQGSKNNKAWHAACAGITWDHQQKEKNEKKGTKEEFEYNFNAPEEKKPDTDTQSNISVGVDIDTGFNVDNYIDKIMANNPNLNADSVKFHLNQIDKYEKSNDFEKIDSMMENYPYIEQYLESK